MNRLFIKCISSATLILTATIGLLISSSAHAGWIQNLDDVTVNQVCQGSDGVLFVDLGVAAPKDCAVQGFAEACPDMWAHLNPDEKGVEFTKEQLLAAYLSGRKVILRIYSDKPATDYPGFCRIGVVINR